MGCNTVHNLQLATESKCRHYNYSIEPVEFLIAFTLPPILLNIQPMKSSEELKTLALFCDVFLGLPKAIAQLWISESFLWINAASICFIYCWIPGKNHIASFGFMRFFLEFSLCSTSKSKSVWAVVWYVHTLTHPSTQFSLPWRHSNELQAISTLAALQTVQWKKLCSNQPCGL